METEVDPIVLASSKNSLYKFPQRVISLLHIPCTERAIKAASDEHSGIKPDQTASSASASATVGTASPAPAAATAAAEGADASSSTKPTESSPAKAASPVKKRLALPPLPYFPPPQTPKCSVCKLTMGCTIQCSVDSCSEHMHPLCAWLRGFHMSATVPGSKADRRIMGAVASLSSSLSPPRRVDPSSSFIYYGGHAGMRFHMLCQSHSRSVVLRESEDATVRQQSFRNRMLPDVLPEPLPDELYEAWHKPRYLPSVKLKKNQFEKNHFDKNHFDKNQPDKNQSESKDKSFDEKATSGALKTQEMVTTSSSKLDKPSTGGRLTKTSSQKKETKAAARKEKRATSKLVLQTSTEPAGDEVVQTKPLHRVKLKGVLLPPSSGATSSAPDAESKMMIDTDSPAPASGEKLTDPDTEPEGSGGVTAPIIEGARKRKLTFKFSVNPTHGSGPQSSPIASQIGSSGLDSGSKQQQEHSSAPPSKKKKTITAAATTTTTATPTTAQRSKNELILRIKAYPAPTESLETAYKGMTYELVID